MERHPTSSGGVTARPRTLAWALVLCSAAPLAHASALVTRYRCTMIDGSSRIVAQNLSEQFGAAVRECTAFAVHAEDPSPVTTTVAYLPPPRAPQETVIWAPQALSRNLAETWPVRKARSASSGRIVVPPDVGALVKAASRRHRLDPQLVAALMYVESRYQPNAVSPKGARGLMQIMPATGARYGAPSTQSLHQPEVNIEIGARYLRDLHDMFDGRIELVLAAYNAGEGAVARYGRRIPPYRETQDYVRKIMALLEADSITLM